MTDRARILFIDNDPDFVQANCIYLDIHGFDIQSASTGALGLKMIAEGKSDVVVIDIMQEGADEGFSIAKTISLELNSHVPVIMLNSIEKAMGYSFRVKNHPDYFPVARFLDKSISPGILAQNIREVLLEGDDNGTQSS